MLKCVGIHPWAIKDQRNLCPLFIGTLNDVCGWPQTPKNYEIFLEKEIKFTHTNDFLWNNIMYLYAFSQSNVMNASTAYTKYISWKTKFLYVYNPLSFSTKKISEYCFIHKMDFLIFKPYNKCLSSIYLYFVIRNGLFGCTQHRIQYLPYVYIVYVIALNNAPFYIHISLCMIWKVDPLGLCSSNVSWNLCILLNSTPLFFIHQNSTNPPLGTPHNQ